MYVGSSVMAMPYIPLSVFLSLAHTSAAAPYLSVSEEKLYIHKVPLCMEQVYAFGIHPTSRKEVNARYTLWNFNMFFNIKASYNVLLNQGSKIGHHAGNFNSQRIGTMVSVVTTLYIHYRYTVMALAF